MPTPTRSRSRDPRRSAPSTADRLERHSIVATAAGAAVTLAATAGAFTSRRAVPGQPVLSDRIPDRYWFDALGPNGEVAILAVLALLACGLVLATRRRDRLVVVFLTGGLQAFALSRVWMAAADEATTLGHVTPMWWAAGVGVVVEIVAAAVASVVGRRARRARELAVARARLARAS